MESGGGSGEKSIQEPATESRPGGLLAGGWGASVRLQESSVEHLAGSGGREIREGGGQWV